MKKSKSILSWSALVVIVVAGVLVGRCAPSGPKGAAKKGPEAKSDVAVAAMKTYVAPGVRKQY